MYNFGFALVDGLSTTSNVRGSISNMVCWGISIPTSLLKSLPSNSSSYCLLLPTSTTRQRPRPYTTISPALAFCRVVNYFRVKYSDIADLHALVDALPRPQVPCQSLPHCQYIQNPSQIFYNVSGESGYDSKQASDILLS